jgi:2-polyprenyl-3-methyl-5-hydroxy-6-metoxy-1,4-benzoquinol methylase
MKKKINNKLEKKAFDLQIQERINIGHTPDIRSSERNEGFYNNVWRDPYLISNTFGRTVDKFLEHIDEGSRVLEVGCGPGHISLEIARNGNFVHGIDLSSECIDLAIKTANIKDSMLLKEERLKYECNDFNSLKGVDNKFDAVVFCGSLSHFPDLKKIPIIFDEILKSKSKILIWDTCINQYERSDAVILAILKTLLSQNGSYFEKIKLSESENELNELIDKIFHELRYEDSKGDNLQSPNDNSQDLQSMMIFLNKNFHEIEFTWESSFSRMLVGGIRAENIESERRLINFIWNIERLLIDSGLLNPAFFHWIGSKKS